MQLWVVYFVCMSLHCSVFGFTRSLFKRNSIRLSLPTGINFSTTTQPTDEDMTKSKIYNTMKTAVKKSITRSTAGAAFAFKTGPGEYAEHDKFLGVSNPDIRKIAKDFKNEATLNEIQLFLESEYNEERFLGLVLLIDKYETAVKQENKKPTKKTTASSIVITSEHSTSQLYQFYVDNLKHVNNWNLVDLSAPMIVGAHLLNRDRGVLLRWTASTDLWERRVAVVSTLHFIRQSDLEWTFKLAELLLTDSHDLMHKATGWMLREAGKRDIEQLRKFLNQYAPAMPRTMLRYSIEKLSAAERKKYLKMKSKDDNNDDNNDDENIVETVIESLLCC